MAIRKVLFYELRPTKKNLSNWIFDASSFVAHLERLEPSDRRLFPTGDNGMVAERIPDVTRPAIRFSRCRRVGLPFIERDGVLAADHVGHNESRAEAVHMVFFENNIVGAEFSRDALRPSALTPYLKQIGPGLLPSNRKMRVAPLYEAHTLDQLDTAKEIRGAELKFTPALHLSDASDIQGPERRLAEFASGFSGVNIGFSLSNPDGLIRDQIKQLFAGAIGSHRVTVAKASVPSLK